ncbi:MAG: sigma-70 family RNA polymerase sigma factor [Acidimicrobiaceae bacterium]|nr:sigma-70 family RNA polymerase sigma factor [Acidimicrobiaceae bacterium]MBO0748396.1 sigma-70 family RNA polymerase sigma factor [Acidimicrobiaceae bacterium]
MTDSTLARAQSGDAGAFAELTDPYRRELHVHCYRILGSFQDAEDLLQETLLSAWQALDRFDGRSLRAWLYRIATNRCLNYLRDSSRRPQAAGPIGQESLFANAATSDEPWWLEPYPDVLIGDIESGPEARYEEREAIALSFVAGLQRLPTQQRAALVLRDVLGFSAAEVAEMLGSTPASVNSALQRARSGFESSRDPERVTLRRSPDEAETVERFVDALQAGNLERLVALLTDDARLTMPPEPFEFRGARAVAEFLGRVWGEDVKVVPTRANDAPAFGYYRPDPHADVHRAGGIIVVSVEDARVASITRFGDKGLFAAFGLPRSIAGGG